MKFCSILILLIICVPFSNGISIPLTYLKYFKKRALNVIDKAGPKDQCSRHLKTWIGDVFNMEKLWALQMLDASAKPQSGFLAGNIIHFGNYDQCLKIRVDKGDDGLIEGQYCTVALTPVKNVTNDIAHFLDIVNLVPEVMGVEEGKELKHLIKLFNVLFGVCLPKSCSAESIQKLWNYVEYTFRIPVHVAFNDNYCSHEGKVPNELPFDKYVFWAFGLFFLVICLATGYDVLVCQQFVGLRSNLWEKVLTSFSLHRNLKSTFYYPSANADNAFGCINGLKAISMLWVIFGHRYSLTYISGTLNMFQYFEWRKSLVALIVLMAPFAVDTFLTISGLLLAYKYMEMRDILPPNKPFPYVMFYFLRFLRLWPALIATILLYTSISKYFNSGPYWTLVAYRMSVTCTKSGWVTALFMSNLVKYNLQCVEPAWYLAVDTQLYCVAPLLLHFLYKYPKTTTVTFISLSVTSALYTYIVTVNNRVKWAALEGDEQYHSMVYQSTFVRMPSWIFGLLTGTFLYNFPQIKIPKVITSFFWAYCIIICFAIARATNVMTNSPYNEYSSGLYNAMARSAWSLAICLIICMCATSHGGMVNKILSLNIFKILVKFSYSTYLLHLAIITLISGNKRTPSFHNSFITLHAFSGDLPFIFAASLGWYLAFELPFINIAKILIQSRMGHSNAIAANEGKILNKTVRVNKEVVKYSPGTEQLRRKKNR